MRRALPLLLLLCCIGVGIAWADPAHPADAPEVIRKTSQDGPVKATVTVSPARPRLGDPLTLELVVEADPQVTVDMPPFGEALGRFNITSFTPKEERLPNGGLRATQRYQLDAPMSGKQRIPPLRIEFRPPSSSSPPGSAPDGGGTDDIHELLTDEVPIDIASVVPEGQVSGELRPLRGPLPEVFSTGGRWLLGGAGAVVLLAGLFFGWRSLQRRRRHVVRVNAFEAALQRLRALEARGLPEAADLDAWYVELSGIVRRYLEDRYHVRAPELTTEEFLREAQRLLQARHREVLGVFLATCDRVKFAGYRPDAAASRSALEEARSFLHQTQPGGSP